MPDSRMTSPDDHSHPPMRQTPQANGRPLQNQAGIGLFFLCWLESVLEERADKTKRLAAQD